MKKKARRATSSSSRKPRAGAALPTRMVRRRSGGELDGPPVVVPVGATHPNGPDLTIEPEKFIVECRKILADVNATSRAPAIGRGVARALRDYRRKRLYELAARPIAEKPLRVWLESVRALSRETDVAREGAFRLALAGVELELDELFDAATDALRQLDDDARRAPQAPGDPLAATVATRSRGRIANDAARELVESLADLWQQENVGPLSHHDREHNRKPWRDFVALVFALGGVQTHDGKLMDGRRLAQSVEGKRKLAGT